MAQQTELRREMGLFSSANVLIGIMVGSGIFYLGSYVLMRCGMSLGLALAVWVVGGIVTLLSGLCYAELGAMMPKAGGSYVYIKESYGEGAGYVSGLTRFIIGSCGSTAGLAIAFPTAISSLIPLSTMQIKLIAVASVVILTVINIYGVKQGAMVQNIFTVGKMIPIGIILFAGLFMGNQTPDLSLIPQTGEAVSITTIIGMIAFATVATLWAYEGWTNLNTISEEIKNPQRNIPRAITLSIVLVTVLYTLFNYAIYRVVPVETITASIEAGQYYLGTEAAGILFGNAGALLVGVCMVIAIFGALNGCVLVFPRSCFAIARDGMLPRQCAQVHPRYQTPHISLLVHMVITILLIFTRNLGQITALVTFSGMIFNTMTFHSVLQLRKKMPDLERPYRVSTVVVYVTIAIMLGLMVNSLMEDFITAMIGLAVLLGTYISYLVFKRNRA